MITTKQFPETVLQFGEGGFLRGFADWMLQKMKDQGLFSGSVVVVQPIGQGMCELLDAQNCRYTHMIRGEEGVEITPCDVISRCVKPYDDWDAYLALAEIPTLRFVISNTTEAGIVFCAEDRVENAPHISFPAKLTLLLHRRYQRGLGGLLHLPCELTDRNGDNLKTCVLQYAGLWSLGADFEAWIERECVFCNTLVDRINTGYPKGEQLSLAEQDPLLNTSEYFHLWVIETAYDLFRELPFDRAGLNVILTRDQLEMYRQRKVRILNGAHTSLVPYALLSGLETVGDCMKDATMRRHLKMCVFDEILPTLDLPREELEAYADDVMVRFSNPYIKHYLSSIALNSASTFRVRVLPSILEYQKRFGIYPPTLVFSFAKLIEFYRKGEPKDAPEIIRFIRSATLAQILEREDYWGRSLSYLYDEVKKYVDP